MKRLRGALPAPERPREEFLPLPVDRPLELVWDLDADWDGTLALPDVTGARVKCVLRVVEERAALADPAALRRRVLEAGAVFCKTPEVVVLRRRELRDERHAVDLPLEESLRLFAAETLVPDPEAKVAFAAALAREADAGVRA